MSTEGTYMMPLQELPSMPKPGHQRFSSLPTQPSSTSGATTGRPRAQRCNFSIKKKHLFICVMLILLSILALGIVSVTFLKLQGTADKHKETADKHKETEDKHKETVTFPASCLEALNNNNAEGNGVYYILDRHNISYPVYCDMAINNGGWTLVASIHENNIHLGSGKCTSGDKWSSEYGNHRGSQIGAEAWSNYQIFGDVRSATSDDYKNAAYFDLKARDVMIWQVPNDTPLDEFSSASYLQYRTTDGFLSRYEGNLFKFYKTYFPIKSGMFTSITDNGPAIPVIFDKGNGSVLIELIPKLMKSRVEVGYIEFRPVNLERNAYALCPGTRGRGSRNTNNLEHTCIGSTADNDLPEYCGDFASYVYDNYGSGQGWNAHLKLLKSTYLIFYR